MGLKIIKSWWANLVSLDLQQISEFADNSRSLEEIVSAYT